MAASALAASKLKNIPNSLLHTLIRRNALHPSPVAAAAAAASNLIPFTSCQSPYTLLQISGVKAPVNSSTAYSPMLHFRAPLMQIDAARTYVTKDDIDYVDHNGGEEYDDIDDSCSDEEDIENYAEYTDNEDESEDSDNN